MTHHTPFARAAAYIEEHGWIQGELRDESGAVCLTGALREIQQTPGEWLVARAIARHRRHAEDWNDDEDRTEADVLAWLATADPITAEELEAVFGPQQEQICAFIRRSAGLTSEEKTRLAAAWDAAWDAAGAAAAWDAARAAARDAGVALCVRDLIGQDFTQDHYDILTYPWRTIIGPLQPGDVELEA